MTLTTNGTANTLNFTIPQGQTGAAGSNASGGSGTASGGAVFSAFHALPGIGSGLQYYSVSNSSTLSTDNASLLTLMPGSCSISSINLYNTGAQGAELLLRVLSSPTAIPTMTACTNIGAGASTCNFNAPVQMGGKLVDFQAGSASGSSSLYTVFTCN